MIGVTRQDFQFVNEWKVDNRGPFFRNYETGRYEPMYIVNMTSGRRYLNESEGTVGIKCFLLTLATPIVQTVCCLALAAFSLMKLLVLYPLWKPVNGLESRKQAVVDEVKGLLLNLVAPVLLELSAIYGMFSPYNGRNLYASLERAVYGDGFLAPCFQPSPYRHFFGGDINKQNAY